MTNSSQNLFTRVLNKAIHNSDEWVVEFEYCDSKGNKTCRTVSPIRFLGKNRFLALCLGREEPRQFYMERCDNLRLKMAHEVLMPVAM